MRRSIILAVLALIILTVFPIVDIHAETTQLTVIHSSHLNGYLLPCPT